MKHADDARLRAAARRFAEDRIREAATLDTLPHAAGPIDAAKLIHELQVHQVELEMQNQELAQSRAEAEAALSRYAELYDFAPVGYFTLTPDGTILQANLTGAGMLGVARSRLAGTRLGIFVADEDRRAFNVLLANACERQRGGMCEVALAPSPHTADQRHFLQITMAGVAGGGACRAAATDVTPRRAAEAQQRASQRMEAVGELAGGIARDFNGILTVIQNESELSLARDALPPDLRQSLLAMKSGAERGAALTRQLLAISSRQVLQSQVVEINDAVRVASRLLCRTLGDDIDVVLSLSKGAGRVDVDPSQLDQVILNFAINARDAMPSGGTLTFATLNVEVGESGFEHGVALAPGLFVRLTISDTGSGMDAATMARVFEPLFTTKGKGEGTGLGLSTVYGIVKQCGGGVAVESKLGGGSVFEVYLPRTLAPVSDGSPSAPPFAAPSRGGETILVVEDEPALRDIVRRVLVSAGYRVLTASNGVEAIRVCEAHLGAIHLALSDVMMPGMSVEAFGESLKLVRPEARLLYMSGYTDNDFRKRYGLDRTRQFIGKPFTPSALQQKVRDVLAAVGD